MLFSGKTLRENHLSDNKTELLPGLLLFVLNIDVLLIDNIACEQGLSNGTQRIFRELVYGDQANPTTFQLNKEVFLSSTINVSKPLYAIVEINTSQVETNLDGLRSKLIPIKQLFGRLLE